MNTQLERASQLAPGARFTQAKLSRALTEMRRALAADGFRNPAITESLTPHPEEQLVDLAFDVTSGPEARVGTVQVTGDSGMSAEEFRRYAHLRSGAHVDRDTVSRALAGVLKHYQSEGRLEAEIKLEQEQYIAATEKGEFPLYGQPGSSGQGAGGRREHRSGAAEARDSHLRRGDRGRRSAERRQSPPARLLPAPGLLRRESGSRAANARRGKRGDSLQGASGAAAARGRGFSGGKPLLRFRHAHGAAERSRRRFPGPPWGLQPGAGLGGRKRIGSRLPEQRLFRGEDHGRDEHA